MPSRRPRPWIPGLLVAVALGVLAAAALLVMQVSVDRLEADREARLAATGQALAAALRGLDPWFVDPAEAERARRRLSRQVGALGLREATVLELGDRVLFSTSGFLEPGDVDPSAVADPDAVQAAWSGRPTLSEPFHLEEVPFQAAFTPLRDEEGRVATLLVTVAGREAFEELAFLEGAYRAVVAVAVALLAGLGILGLRLGRRAAHAEAELEHRQRLALAGQVAAGVVHEIRNPLGILRSTLEFLREERRAGRDTAAETEELTGECMEEVDRIEEILERFLALARHQPPEPRRVRLGEVVESCLRLAGKDLERRGMELAGEGLDATAAARVDDRGLRQALLNLILNARQAMEEAGTEEPRVVVRLEPGAPAGVHRLTVADRGPGFPADVLAEPSRAFRTGRPEGTGLGLALVARYAEQSGGRLVLENPAGGGARATLELPAAGEEESR